MPVFSSAKERRIIALLEKGCTYGEIIRAEDVSHPSIKRLEEKTGIRALKHHNAKNKEMLVESQFECLGIGNCKECNHQFQFPCKIGYYS